MRIQRFLMMRSSDFGHAWKHQMLLGVLLVLTAFTIVLVPEILAVLVAAGILAVGAALIGSAWAMRRLDLRRRESSIAEKLEW